MYGTTGKEDLKLHTQTHPLSSPSLSILPSAQTEKIVHSIQEGRKDKMVVAVEGSYGANRKDQTKKKNCSQWVVFWKGGEEG
jgi:hypothetical protein